MADKELWELPVNYGAVGATQSAEILAFPPQGYRVVEKRVRIGTGPARWDFASQATLAWGILVRSGFEVELSETPPEVTEGSYSPVNFDTGGVPIPPSSHDRDETVFGPDGLPFVRPGDSARMVAKVGPFRQRSPVRVIYVIDEPRRKGVGLGTLPGHPISGEEAFFTELADDGSVWLTMRVLWRPATTLGRVGLPVVAAIQAVLRARYAKALTGPVD